MKRITKDIMEEGRDSDYGFDSILSPLYGSLKGAWKSISSTVWSVFSNENTCAERKSTFLRKLMRHYVIASSSHRSKESRAHSHVSITSQMSNFSSQSVWNWKWQEDNLSWHKRKETEKTWRIAIHWRSSIMLFEKWIIVIIPEKEKLCYFFNWKH